VLRFTTFTGWLAPIPLRIASGAVIEAELREQPGVAIRNVHRMACANTAFTGWLTFTGWLAPIPLELHVTCGGFQQCTCIETKPTYTTFP